MEIILCRHNSENGFFINFYIYCIVVYLLYNELSFLFYWQITNDAPYGAPFGKKSFKGTVKHLPLFSCSLLSITTI